MNNLKNKIIYFFFVDSLKDFETNNYLKVDKYFQNFLISNNKFFSVFRFDKVNFDFLEKNDKLLTFFIFNNTIFFKDQLKNLKLCLFNENFFENSKIKIINKFYLNLYFFFRHLLAFLFILKNFYINKKIIK